MRVDLSKLFNSAGETMPFSGAIDLSDAKRWGRPLFDGAIQITGQAENRSGIVSVRYAADFVLDVVCDRCLTSLAGSKHKEFSHTVVLSLNHEDNDEFIVIPDGKLNLAELAASDILLDLPISIVCDQGCKGLCPVCGANLNEKVCGCDRKAHDPRLDPLRALLQDL